MPIPNAIMVRFICFVAYFDNICDKNQRLWLCNLLKDIKLLIQGYAIGDDIATKHIIAVAKSYSFIVYFNNLVQK